jgi:hypothetical protein
MAPRKKDVLGELVWVLQGKTEHHAHLLSNEPPIIAGGIRYRWIKFASSDKRECVQEAHVRREDTAFGQRSRRATRTVVDGDQGNNGADEEKKVRGRAHDDESERGGAIERPATAVAVAEQLDDTFWMLDTTARAFLAARDIETTNTLLHMSTHELASDLLDWRRQRDINKWQTTSANNCIMKWKKCVREVKYGGEGIPETEATAAYGAGEEEEDQGQYLDDESEQDVFSRTRKPDTSRWHTGLDANIDGTTARTVKWTEDEAIKLKDAVQRHGGKNWMQLQR